MRYNISSGLGKMVFLKALEMSKTNRMRNSVDQIDMIMQRELMPVTGAYDTVK